MTLGKLLYQKLVEIGFVQSLVDLCVYFRSRDGVLLEVGVYMDDLLVTGTEQAAVDALFGELSSLSAKDLGRAHKFLGMRANCDDECGYEMDQEVTIRDLLREHGIELAHGVRSPVGDEWNESAVNTGELHPVTGSDDTITVSSFQSLVGSLLWLARYTHPNIAFAVHKATRRAHILTMTDWKLYLRYLAGTRALRLRMHGKGDSRKPLEVVAYSDADFAADKEDRRSVIGGFITMDGMAIGWVCIKQGGVSLSTMEAEYTATSVMGQELLGIRELLNELDVAFVEPLVLKVDNQAALKQLEGERASSKAKHIDVRIKFIVHHTRRGVLKAEYCDSEHVPANLLTKVLPAPRLSELRTLVGLQ